MDTAKAAHFLNVNMRLDSFHGLSNNYNNFYGLSNRVFYFMFFWNFFVKHKNKKFRDFFVVVFFLIQFII